MKLKMYEVDRIVMAPMKMNIFGYRSSTHASRFGTMYLPLPTSVDNGLPSYNDVGVSSFALDKFEPYVSIVYKP